MHVLVVGDNRQAGASHCQALQAAGFRTEQRTQSHTDVACRLPANIGAPTCAAVVLDCRVPDCKGACPLRPFRADNPRLPVVVIATNPAADRQVNCLEAGADDYLAQPYEAAVLVARVRALVRRQAPPAVTVLHVGDLRLDLVTRVATRGAQTMALTPREWSLLQVLMEKPGTVFRRKELVAAVWGADFVACPNIVNENIRRLREKIDASSQTKLIHTKHWKGYMVKAE